MAKDLGGAAAPDQKDEVHPERVQMYGDFVDSVTLVKNSLMSLLLAVGSLERQEAGGADDAAKPVLVPFVEMKLEGEEEPYFAQVLTFDNVAYLIYDLTSDFKAVCEQLVAVSEGGLPPESGRIERSRDWIKLASQLAADAYKDLETIAARRPQ